MLAKFRALLASSALVTAACASDDGGSSGGQPRPAVVFSDQVDEIVIEVDYMEGAEPYVGPVGDQGDLWDLFGNNMRAVFPEDLYLVEHPSTLDDMELIENPSQDGYTVNDILGLAATYRDEASEGSRASYYVVWIDGFFADSSGIRDGVLGVSIGSTGVVAMFKPVISGAAALPIVARFAEQSTLIHELGHAIGLVNNGIPLSTDHHDAPNGAHCTNDRCVMFWAFESISSIIQFAQQTQMDGTTVLFDADCITDVEMFRDR